MNMQSIPLLIPFSFLAGSILLCSRPAESQIEKQQSDEQMQFRKTVPNEYLITVKPGIGESEIKSAFASMGEIKISRISNLIYLIKIEKDPGLQEIEKLAASSPDIKSIQPNYIYRALP